MKHRISCGLTGARRESTEPMLQTYAGRDLVALPYETAIFESRLRLFYRRKTYMSPAVQKFRPTWHEALSST